MGTARNAVVRILPKVSRTIVPPKIKQLACLLVPILILGIVWITLDVSAAAGQNQRSEKPTTAFDPSQFPKYRSDRVLVRFRPGVDRSRMQAFHAKLGDKVVSEPASVDRLQIVQIAAGATVKDAIKSYRSNPDVLYAEPDYLVHALETPNDPFFSSQWNLQNIGQNGGTPGADIRATEAWNITTGSASVVIAVLDTGIDYTHPDLAANVWTSSVSFSGVDQYGVTIQCGPGSHGFNAVAGTCDPMDDNDHGSHVSGIMGAAGNNGIGVAGVDWSMQILPCKFLDASGEGDLASAISCLDVVEQLKDAGVNIIATSNSWGGATFSQALQDAVQAQMQDNILCIAAAGNDFADNDAVPEYPASIALPNVISVAATDNKDQVATFSDLGRHTVHLGAPGVNILSTTPNDTYSVFSGTSMATPHVAGVAALLKAQDPTRDWRAIKNLILAGGDTIASLANTITGKRLDAYGSLTCSNANVDSRLQPVPSTISGSVNSPITLSVLNINCASGAGDVTVQVSPGGQSVTLLDDGTGADLAPGDGIYTAQWTPQNAGSYALTFPDSSVVDVEVLNSYGATQVASSYQPITGTNLNLSDDSVAAIASPFAIPFGGGSFTNLYVSSNGTISFTDAFSDFSNWSLAPGGFPDFVQRPTTLVAPFWMDLDPSQGTNQNVFWQVTGSPPNRMLVIEWRNVPSFMCRSDATANVTFEVVFEEGSSNIRFNYSNVVFGGDCASIDYGQSATIGIQPSTTTGVNWGYGAGFWVSNGMSLLWQSPPATGANNPIPTLTSISPTSAPIFSPSIPLTVNGSGFMLGSTVQWSGSNVPTTYVNATQLTAILPSEVFEQNSLYSLGALQIAVTNPAPGGGTSNAVPFTIVGPGIPSITSVSPDSVFAGGFGFYLDVIGNNLLTASIYWNGQLLDSFDVSNTECAAVVPANLVASAGTVQIQAITKQPGGGNSNTVLFTITSPNPGPELSSPGSQQVVDVNSNAPLNVPPPLSQRFVGWKMAQKFGEAYVKRFSRSYAPTQSVPSASSTAVRGAHSGISSNSSVSLTQPKTLPGFALHPDLPAGYIPTSITTGDFNRDGKMDWVISNGGSNNLWIYFGNGDGTSQLPVIIPLAGAAPLQVVAADLRNNGILDLVVAEADSQTVGVLLGNGDGTFQPEVEYYVPGPPLSVAVADFNKDGHLDIVAGLEGGPTTGPFATLLGDGTGRFGTPLTRPSDRSAAVGEFTGTTVLATDLNGDGYPDILVLDQSQGGEPGLHSYVNRGDGTFKHSEYVFATDSVFTYVTNVAAGDMNEDGCVDAITTEVSGLVRIFNGNCDGTFQGFPAVTTYGAGEAGASIQVADMNGDGHLDVVTAGAYWDTTYGGEATNLVTVLTGDGKENLSLAKVYRSEPAMFGLALADLNGDRLPDVIVAGQDTDTAAVFLNDGSGNFAGPAGEYIGYLENNGGGGLNVPASDFLVSDINGDGKADLALIELPRLVGDPWDLAVMLGDGTGHFAPAVRTPIAPQPAQIAGYTLGDFHKTGRPDLIESEYPNATSGTSTPQLLLFPNVGSGQFGQPSTIAANYSVIGGGGLIATADFNNDGNLDFVLSAASNPPGQGLSITLTAFLANGDGTFREEPTQTFDSGSGSENLRPAAIFTGDFNGDGKPDVLLWVNSNVSGSAGQYVYEFLGNGDGTFAPPKILFQNFGPFTVADLNHDGLPDIVEYSSSGISVYLCQHDGTFQLSNTYPAYSGSFFSDYLFDNGQPEQGGASPMVADFNGDGNLDIAVFQSEPSYPQFITYLQILAGNGDGTFTPTYNVTQFNKADVPQTAVDVNGDGRADLIEVDDWPSSFHAILAAAGPPVQLTLPTNPVVGTQGLLTVNISVASASAATVTLSASDPNIVMASSVTIPAGSVSASVPFSINPQYNSSKVFALSAQLDGQSTSVYSYQTNIALAGFLLSVNSAKQSAPPTGLSRDYGLTVTSYGGYSSTVQLSCQGLPSGAACQWGSNPLPVPPYQPETTTLQVSIAGGTAVGAYPFTAVVSDGFVTQQISLTLNVADFNLQLTPSSTSVMTGSNSANLTLTIGALGAWTDLIYATCGSTPPAGTGCGETNGYYNLGSYPTPFFAYGLTPGDYLAMVTGTADGVSHTSSPVTIHVEGVTAGLSPTQATISAGSSAMFNVSVTSQNGYTDQLTFSCVNLPSNVRCAFNPPSGALTASGTLTSALTVTVAASSGSGSVTSGARLSDEHKWLILFALILSMLLVLREVWSTDSIRPRRIWRISHVGIVVLLSMIIAAGLASCGGGGGSGESAGTSTPPSSPPSQPSQPAPTEVVFTVQASSPNVTVTAGTITVQIP
jgi:subtilisin family serine protease